jgi:hypothetical protein
VLDTVRAGCRVRLVPQPAPAGADPRALAVALSAAADSTVGGDVADSARLWLDVLVDSRALDAALAGSGLNPDALARGIALCPVLFTQGINETQTLANLLESSGVATQAALNRASLRRLAEYHGALARWLTTTAAASAQRSPGDVGLERAAMDEALRSLSDTVERSDRASKDVAILLGAETTVRALNGGRITFCKSGKDRTAMSATIEQVRLLRRMPGQEQLARLDELHAANLEREYGTRIVVAEKNVGRPKYSFNAAQRQLLPQQYRPPTATIQDFFLSVSARDS